VDRRIKRDIERILILAQKVKVTLERKKINKAKRQIRRIIKFDLDELARLQQEHGDKRLLEECSIVFRDAKRALYDLDSTELFDDAKKIIDEIAALEGHELLEVDELEKKKDELYKYWRDTFSKFQFTHCTSLSIAKEILRFGVKPGYKPEIFRTAEELNNKLRAIPIIGRSELQSKYYDNYDFSKRPFYISPLYLYNKYSVPEFVGMMISTGNGAIDKIEHIFIASNGNYDTYQSIMRKRGYAIAYTFTEKYFKMIDFDGLRKELPEIKRLVNVLVKFSDTAKPTLLLIDVKGILNYLPSKLERAFLSFDAFVKIYPEEAPFKDDESLRKWINVFFRNELAISGAIDQKYIHLKELE